MKFKNQKQAARFMKKLSKQLLESNGPISPFISRRDNNDNFEIAYRLKACAKRIKEGYKNLDY